MKPHFDLVIATPGHSMKSAYVKSLLRTTCHLNELGLTYTFLNQQSSLVSDARERTASNTESPNWETSKLGSGAFTYDSVIWIDSDMEWEPGDVMKLFESSPEHPIISGVCISGPERVTNARGFGLDGEPTPIHADDLLVEWDPLPVWGVGFGFILMRQGVFENILRPWFVNRTIQLQGNPYQTNVGEDLSFCIGAREAGFEIWLDPQVKVSHHKEAIFKP